MLKILCFVGLSFLLTITNVVHCKPEYLFYEEVGGWLKLHKIPASWEEAFLRCHQEGAVLASPLNEQLADALNSLIREAQFNENATIYLGTHDLYSKGHFVSIEGMKLTDMPIKWGASGTMDSEDCLCMLPGPAMSICSCTVPRLYMCYRKLDNQTMNECGTFDNEYHFKQCTGSCYKLHQRPRTWSEAFGICESEGGHLVILNDKEEASIVKDLFPEGSDVWARFHVGLAAWTDDRIWTTIHGDKLEDMFNVWSSAEPNNQGGNQNRVSFYKGSTLDDIHPALKAMFVCEKSPQSKQFEMPENLQGQGTEELY